MVQPLVADGSDFVVVVAEITDDNGNVRRLAREHVSFSVEGEGIIIGDASIAANPRQVEWGTAPVLIRSTHKAGPIHIIARPTFGGVHAPSADTLTIHSVAYTLPQCYQEASTAYSAAPTGAQSPIPHSALSPEERRRQLEEVERQQQDFGIEK